MKFLLRFNLCLGMLLIHQALFAQVVESSADDEVAIRAAGKAYVEAFQSKDAAALAKFWSPEAVYTNRISGEQVVGQKAIAEQFSAIFADEENLNLAVETNSIDFVSPNVAVEHGVAKYSRKDSEPEKVAYTAVYVRRDGNWLLDRVTDKPVQQVKSNYAHLKPLEWMIGSWTDDNETTRVITECQWTKNRNFIRRAFTVSHGEEINLSGMQIIGWDPIAKQIRSWTFDSDGGFSEGQWTQDENLWTVKKSGITPEGARTAATNVIKKLDDNSFNAQSIHRSIDGDLLPNVNEFRVVRTR